VEEVPREAASRYGVCDLKGAGEMYPRVYELLQVSTAVFTDAITIFERYDDQALSFTDATTAALIDRHGLDGVLSFDDFDGVVERVDPETV
jgi:predicted nucleic acid-binding protein